MPQSLLEPCFMADLNRYRGDGVAGVWRHEWAPGDGWLYVVYTSDLPISADGGHRHSHVLVTLHQPIKGSHVLGTEGTLSPHYLDEKFPALAGAQPYTRTEMMRLIGTALDRPVMEG